MDIRNFIRVESVANTDGLDRIERSVDKLFRSYDRLAASQRRLSSSGNAAERVLREVQQAAVRASSATSAAVGRMSAAVEASIRRLGSLSAPARTGFGQIAAAAEGAARRTAAAFQRLRVALPRIGIENLTRPFTQLAQAATAGFARASTAVRGFLTTAERAAVRFQFGVIRRFRLYELERDIASSSRQFHLLQRSANPMVRIMANIGQGAAHINAYVRDLSTQIKNAGLATTFFREQFNVLHTAADVATAAIRRTIAAARTLGNTVIGGVARGIGGVGPPVGGGGGGMAVGGAAAAGGWNLVARAAYAAGAAMRTAGVIGVAALRGIASAATTTASLVSTGIGTLSIAIGALGFVAVSTGARFEQSLSKITALTNVVAENFGGNLAQATAGLTEEILKLTRIIPRTPDELGAGLYFILSAGIRDVTEAYEILRVSAEAAVAGQTSVEVVADAVTSAILAYGLGADAARGITDALTQAVIEGKTEFDTFAASIGRVLPAAANIGISFEEVAASLAVLTRVGLNSEEAATAIRAAFLNLTAAAPETKKALASIGLSISDVQTAIRERGFLAVANELYNAFGGNIEQLDKIIPNIRALTGFLVLGGSGAQVAAEAYERVRGATEGAGRTSDAFRTAMTTLISKLGLLRNSLIEIGVMIYAHLEKPLKAAIEGLTGFFNSIADWMAANERLAGSIIRITGALATLGLIAFGLPRLLQGAGLFFGLFGAFGLTTIRTRESLARLGAVLRTLAPIFVLTAAAGIGLGRVFDIELGIGIDRARASLGRLLGSSADVLRGVKNLFVGIVAILRTPFANAEDAITPLQRFQGLVMRWQEDQRENWRRFREDVSGIFVGLGWVFGNIVVQMRPILANLGAILSTVGPEILAGIGSAANGLIEGGARLVDSLVRGMIAGIPRVGEGLNQIRTAVVDWITATVPVIAGRLEQWFSAFVGWISDVGPQLIDALGRVLGDTLTWIVDAAPRIAATLGAWASAFVGWIVFDAIPRVLAALGRLIDAILRQLESTNAVARITAALIEWTAAFLGWVAEMTPRLLAALAIAIGQIAAFLVVQGPRLAVALLGGFLEGIRRGFDDLNPILSVLASVVLIGLIPAFTKWTLSMVRAADVMAGLLLRQVGILLRNLGLLAITIVGRVIGAFRAWRAEIQLLTGATTTLTAMGLAGAMGSVARNTRNAATATSTLARSGGVTWLGGFGGAAGRAARNTRGFGSQIGTLAGRVPIAGRALSGGLALLGRLAGFLPVVGQAVLAFTILYETNILGLRGATDSFVDWTIKRLGDLGNWLDNAPIFGDFNRWYDARVAVEALEGELRELANLDIWGDAGAIQEQEDAIHRLANSYRVDYAKALQLVVELMRLGMGPSAALEAAALQLKTGASAADAYAAALIRAGVAWRESLTPGRGPLPPLDEGIPGLPPPVAPRIEGLQGYFTAAEQLRIDDIAGWRDWMNKINASIFGATDELASAVSQAQQILGDRWVLPDFDLSGMLRPEAIATLRENLKLIPDATADMTAETVLALELLEQKTRDKLDDLTYGLDTLAATFDRDLPMIRDKFRALYAETGDPGLAMTELKALLEAGWGTGPDLPLEFTPPEPAVITSHVTALRAHWAAQLTREFGGGEGAAITLPDTAMDVSGVGAGAGQQIATDLAAQAPLVGTAARTLSLRIRAMLAIASEPTDATSGLAGITRWGFGIVNTISLGVLNNITLAVAAVRMLTFRMHLPLLKFAEDAYDWGYSAGRNYINGLKAALASAAATINDTLSTTTGDVLQGTIGLGGHPPPVTYMPAGPGGGRAASNAKTDLLLEQLVTEQQRNNELTAAMVKSDPTARGPLRARGTLSLIQAQVPTRRN